MGVRAEQRTNEGIGIMIREELMKMVINYNVINSRIMAIIIRTVEGTAEQN